MVDIAGIKDAAKDIINLLDDYWNGPDRETRVDPALYAHFRARHVKCKRQHKVYLYGSTKPKRIDFRFGGSNPVVLELVVKPPKGGPQLYGGQNVSELRKLCRVKQSQAKLRVLLLIDLHTQIMTKQALETSYKKISSGRGRFQRNPVRVLYVHKDGDFGFLWKIV